jgi:hypothetical protein
MNPMMIATPDSWRIGIWIREGYLLHLDKVCGQYVDDEYEDEYKCFD